MKLCNVIRTDVNGLLSDSQISHILRHLHNTGIVSYNIICYIPPTYVPLPLASPPLVCPSYLCAPPPYPPLALYITVLFFTGNLHSCSEPMGIHGSVMAMQCLGLHILTCLSP